MNNENSTNGDIGKAAMEIIIHAGDARMLITEALEAIAKQDFDLYEKKLAEAHKEMKIAHGIQTDIIQGENSLEETEYLLLFTHAQDTLMTIASELNITKQMYKIFKGYEERISALEEK